VNNLDKLASFLKDKSRYTRPVLDHYVLVNGRDVYISDVIGEMT